MTNDNVLHPPCWPAKLGEPGDAFQNVRPITDTENLEWFAQVLREAGGVPSGSPGGDRDAP